MTQIIVVGKALGALSAFTEAFEKGGAGVTCVDNGKEAVAALLGESFDLLVADEQLEDMPGLELIETVVTRQPMLNCAVVSSLSPEDYHEASEGLGILMPLPPESTAADGARLMSHLNQILGLAAPIPAAEKVESNG